MEALQNDTTLHYIILAPYDLIEQDSLAKSCKLRGRSWSATITLSRGWGSVTIKTGSGLDDWIYWPPSITITLNYNQLWQLTIGDCLRLAPFFTGLRVSSLLLWLTWFSFYESVASSDSAVRWLPLHSWTMNHDWIWVWVWVTLRATILSWYSYRQESG
jgi:hypothetical protein